MEIALGAGMSYDDTVEGNIVLGEKDAGWVAVREGDEITEVIAPNGKSVVPELWLASYRLHIRHDD